MATAGYGTGYDLRLVAYTPFGPLLGILPEPLTFTWTYARYATFPVLTVTYEEEGIRSNLLEQRVEVALEWRDDNHNWQEDDNCRTLRIKRSWNYMDGTRRRQYTLYGLGWTLAKLTVHDSDTLDPGDPPKLPVRTFTDATAGEIMVPLWNAAKTRAFTGTVTEPPTKDFETADDYNEVAWTTPLPGDITFRTEDKLANVERLLIDAGMAQFAWHKREYRAFNFGTYGQDVSEGPNAVTVRYASGVTSSPEDQSDEDLAKRITVTGKRGQTTEILNASAVDDYGILEQAVGAPSADDVDAMEQIAHAEKIIGETEQEQISREWEGSDGPRPFRDIGIDWRVKLQRSIKADDDSRFVRRYTVEMSVTKTRGQKIKGHFKFSDRHEDRTARALRMLSYASHGSITGPGGPVSDEPIDARFPTAPTSVSVSTTPYVGDHKATLGDQVVTWAHDGLATDGTPINVAEWVIGLKRFGGDITEIGRIKAGGALTWRTADIAAAARRYSVMAISKQGFQSAWATDVDGTVSRLSDPTTGLGRVLDPQWANTDINTKRQANAGTGFAFGTSGGRTRAQFTSVTPTLRANIGGYSDQGWQRVNPLEKWLVGGTHRRVGGSAVNARFGVRWRDLAGTVTEVANVVTAAAGTSDARSTGEWTVPSGAYEAAWRAVGTSFAGGETLEIVDPVFERRLSNERAEDDAVDARTIIATDPLTTKHTVTGPLVQSHSGSTTGAKLTTSGIFYYVSGTAKFSATSSGVFVTGTLTTGSGMIVGGSGLFDIQFPSGSSYAIGESGGFLEYKAGGSGHKFTGALLASGAITGSLGLTIGGTTALNGAATVAGSGFNLGFYGATPVAKQSTATKVLGSNVTADAVRSLASILANLGLLVNNIS